MEQEDVERHSARGMYHFAEDFYKAAAQLVASHNAGDLSLRFQNNVSYHLYMHSMELTLKAFLNATGTSNNDLRRQYGHNIAALLSAAIAAGMALGEHEAHTQTVVDWLNKYGKAQAFRYFEQGYYKLPSEADVAIANERLLAAAKIECLKAIRKDT